MSSSVSSRCMWGGERPQAQVWAWFITYSTGPAFKIFLGDPKRRPDPLQLGTWAHLLLGTDKQDRF